VKVAAVALTLAGKPEQVSGSRASPFNSIERKLQAVSENNKTWMCLICGWMYDEAQGDPEHGIAPGTAWADVPMNWTCPECGARKEDFEMVQI
jgi:rubredoxin